jgi:alkylated DNA repair dioxygenase AlkB
VGRQLSLLGSVAPRFDRRFAGLRRTVLEHDAWIDHQPGWLSGDDELFDRLERGMRWRAERRPMYDHIVEVPRLLAAIPDDGDGDPIIEDMRVAISERYGEKLERVSMALYRDGKDSVASHGDTTARDLPQALVATLSLGHARRLLLRPTAGGRSLAFELGQGDLFVMGGTCQRTWRHSVPKVAAAGPRIAVMFRPVFSGS